MLRCLADHDAVVGGPEAFVDLAFAMGIVDVVRDLFDREPRAFP